MEKEKLILGLVQNLLRGRKLNRMIEIGGITEEEVGDPGLNKGNVSEIKIKGRISNINK